MAQRRSIDLLPEIFQTDTNRQFFAATLDQLTQEPELRRIQGFVGRRVGPGVDPADNYVLEPTALRNEYQLEPSVVFLRPDTNTATDAVTYPGMLDALRIQNGLTQRQDRLWNNEYYSWDPFCDFDKFSNYSQYYWLPAGPDSVDVQSTDVALTDDFTVSRGDSYTFSGVPNANPTLVLARGGTYNFTVNQNGHQFWIQTAPGVNGQLPDTPNVSSRNVLGVRNNGDDNGVIQFNVPYRDAQNFYYGLTTEEPVDLICDIPFVDLNNQLVSTVLAKYPNGIDGITELDGRILVFTSRIADSDSGGWTVKTRFDPITRTTPEKVGDSIAFDVNGEPYDSVPYETITDIVVSGESDPLDSADGAFDSIPFDQQVNITTKAQRYGVWQIQYVLDTNGAPYITLRNVRPVPELSRFRIRYGATWSSTEWYKDQTGFLQQIPLLTAVQDELWYQDSTNPDIFGRIRLVDAEEANPILIDEIIGQNNYISPNGVKFTNGLKVQFRGAVSPASYQNQEYIVEGVGTGPGIEDRVGFVDGEAYFGPFHVFEGALMTGAVHDDTVLQQFIYDTVEESLANAGSAGPLLGALPNQPVGGVGLDNGIKLIPVNSLVTPETYTQNELVPYDDLGYDVGNYETTLNSPTVPDYFVSNRASGDRSAWSRCNRWFHKDVIEYSAQLNNTVAVYDLARRAQRPIIEFKPNLQLWEFGTQSQLDVNVIDFQQTDALSQVNGQIGYGVDGFEFLEGTRVIFAADLDREVRNRIFTVNFVDADEDGIKLIQLTPEPNGVARINQTVLCLNGATLQGQSFYFDGSNWVLGQQKTRVNQAPLFDVFDENGVSFGDQTVYPSNTFRGCRLFGYAEGGTTIIDPVIGISFRYLNINNIGDIVFENFLYTDEFVFVRDQASETKSVGDGYARQFIDRVSFYNQIGWQPAAAESRQRQVFRFDYADAPLLLNIPIDDRSVFSPVQIFINGVYVDSDRYTVVAVATSTTITFVDGLEPDTGAVIEVQVVSDVPTTSGYYQIPSNLENNAPNLDSRTFTLGGIRNHFDTIGQNLRALSGPVNGANNIRDLGNIIPYGTAIVQQSSPLMLPGVFLRSANFDVFESLQYNAREYTKYKSIMLDLAARGDFINLTPTQILDSVIEEISLGKTEAFPFYWSDMLPSGDTYTLRRVTVSPITTAVFDTSRIYDFNSSNFQSLLVYLNGALLTRNYDYTVSADSATLTVLRPLTFGDVVEIREYATTYGSYVPNTPTKMGLYPAFRPEIFVDTSYLEPQTVIRGHDGSITVAFGDFRDQVLLEFETRIFNNIKINTPVPLTEADVIPGRFRDTGYSLSEINEILLPDFLSWVGYNNLDYTTQTYDANNQFTYNYSQSGSRIGTVPLLGAWRGIYQNYYDTTAPTTRPWEMLGFSQEPNWWQSVYGPAPYTSGNLVLWRDLERGYIADPDDPRFDARYARPGLTSVIPAGFEGELLSPLYSVVSNYNANSFRRSWTFGDGGPVEYVWRTSSEWPFAVMRLLALTKPAKFFGLMVDRDRYRFDTNLQQYLWDLRYRLDPNTLAPLYGNGQSRASYINWIIDYNKQTGRDSTTELTTLLQNLDVRLCWRLGAFSAKNLLRVFTERSTPRGENRSLQLPDESYQLLLYRNVTQDRIVYSSIMVQRTDTGWAVLGYDLQNSYFSIYASRASGQTRTISAGGTSVTVSKEYTSRVVRVPYGYTFTNQSAVVDFILSYGRWLETNGMVFDNQENGYTLNWDQMAQEFLYWSNQGWATGSAININPSANRLTITREQEVAESLFPSSANNLILNQNRQVVPASAVVIDRLDNTFKITSIQDNTLNYVNLRFTSYEHLVILNNTSIFNELVYDPATGNRQSRILVSGYLSSNWNGTVNAPGFILNQQNVPEWSPNVKYTKGDIVLFKDEYWSANTIIQPSEKFDYSAWIKSDYAEIQRGLLPNAATAANELANAYNTYNANLEQEQDLFSYGLIGFRPREYMQLLDLNDVSQVNLYKQFLDTKGTRRATSVFNQADVGKEIAQYDLYEYWAMLRSAYGANANRSYFEIVLDEGDLQSNPSTVEVTQTDVTDSVADQTVKIEDLWKTSYKITTPNILPARLNPSVSDQGLPGAGFVNLEDVDLTIFSFDNDTIAGVIDQIDVGTTIWAAKVNTYDWNVYRCEKINAVITRVSDNLNSTSTVIFDQAHGLTTGSNLIIKYFNDDINGFYRVLSAPSLTSVTIAYTFVGTQTAVNGTGLALTLQTARVSEPSAISSLPYATRLFPGVKAWVDDNSQGQWTVLEKTDVFVPDTSLTAESRQLYSRFGSAIGQGLFNLSALIGSPGYNPLELDEAPGAIYNFVSDEEENLIERSITELQAANVAGYGNAIDVGAQSWSVAGASASLDNVGYATTTFVAPGSPDFEIRQLLLPPDQDFGASEFGFDVTMSDNEQWMFIGAPGKNKVHAFTRTEVQAQSVTYTSDGIENIYNWNQHLKLNPPPVTADWVSDDSSATLVVSDTTGIVKNMTIRGQGFTENQYVVDVVDGTTLTISAPPNDEPGGPLDFVFSDQILVRVNDEELIFPDDFYVDATDIVLTNVPNEGDQITVTRRSAIQLDRDTAINVAAFSYTGTGVGARFNVINQRGLYVTSLNDPGQNYSVGDFLYIDQDLINTDDAVPPAPVSVTYVSGAAGPGAQYTLTTSSTSDIVVGMTVTGTGFTSPHFVTEILSSTQYVIDSPPDSAVSGTLIFSHDLQIEITEVDVFGRVTGFEATGSTVDAPGGVTDQSVFYLEKYLSTADDIYSFIVRVGSEIYRPFLDYDFNSTSTTTSPMELVFNRVPAAGTTVTVNSGSHFNYVSTITVPGLPADARFGASVSSDTEGAILIVGAPFADSNNGRAYVFDRKVQRFIITDPSQTEYRPIMDMEDPGYISVSLNGRFLLNTDNNFGGEFTVDVSDPMDQYVTISADMTIGDNLEINTNQFTLVETLAAVGATAASRYGSKVDQCVNDCSLYVSAPYDSGTILQGGLVKFLQNQARVYGSITGTIANPTLTIGNYIRINNVFVECTGTSVADLAGDIRDANIPNVTALTTADLTFTGNGSTKIFNVGNLYSVADSFNTRVLVDDVVQVEGVDYTYDAVNQNIMFVIAPLENSEIVVVSGRIIVTVKNNAAAPELDKLKIGSGVGTLIDDLGLLIYVEQQTIRSPVAEAYARFGESLFISDDTRTLLVGAPNGSMTLDTTFDLNNTIFDSDGTGFVDITPQSGVVYSFDALPPARPSLTNPIQFVFGQQFTNNQVKSLDRFGEAINFTTGVLLAGAPGTDFDDSTLADYGEVKQFRNPDSSPVWKPIRTQQPEVDVNLLNTIFMYDRLTGEPLQYFDYFNPLQGRLLGAVKQNIDYIGAVDPADYNVGLVNNNGSRWGAEYVGRIWWDVTNARFIDPNQQDLIYASRRWGQLFPGSSVDVYQWVVSDVPPDAYEGPGVVRNSTSYVTSSALTEQGFLETQYFFWVRDIDTIQTAVGKTLSIATLTRYIENPRGSGISYIAPLSASAVAIYNGLEYISAEDTVLHIEYDRQYTDSAVHLEYALVAENRGDGFLTPNLYRKFLDSMSGADTFGNQVPDPLLSVSEQYGIEFRPRQSFFVNRFEALKNYVRSANAVLARTPIAEQRRFVLLNSFDPEPAQRLGLWDLRVATYQELLFQDLRTVPVGYRYLVASDATNNGLWTIYEVIANATTPSGKILQLYLVQNYDTRRYWNYIDWYEPGYDPLTRILTVVPNVASLDTLTVPEGSSVQVEDEVEDRWEIYRLTGGVWRRVAVEDGTIEISASIYDYSVGNFGFDREVFDAQYFDQAPLIETRRIIDALNTEIFVDDLLIERNKLLILMFNFILTEQESPSWLTKTSLIDVDHIVRDLLPFQNYRRDNQDFILDYINEVKPYHTQIKEFNLKYQGNDTYQGSLTDFDVPAYYDTNQNRFVSPVLDNTGNQSTTSSVPSTAAIWQTWPWQQWYSNYRLSIESVTVINGGSGYTVPPEVIVTGTSVRAAQMRARINSAGRVIAIDVLDAGEGYLTTALISLTGGNGSGAQAVAVMGNTMVRSVLTTLRYDRYEYTTNILTWTAETTYPANSQVRYADRVWTNEQSVTTTEFDPNDWSLVDASTLSGVDRTMGFYVATPSTPGLDLAELISGIDYPGVQVAAISFQEDTGFDLGPFDVTPFDNLSIDAAGTQTYDVNVLDAQYESAFSDSFLGTRPTDINVDGGGFVDTYSSHAPEELVPGIGFDTLDFRVYTTAGDDWVNNGHGFPAARRNFEIDMNNLTVSWADLLRFPVQVLAWNITTRTQLNFGFDYSIDWINYTVTFLNNIKEDDLVTVTCYGLAGGNQINTLTYTGDQIGNRLVYPLQTSVINELVIFSNGTLITDFTYTADVQPGYTVINFATTFTSTDRVTITALGESQARPGTTWSVPVTQYIVSDGSVGYTLTNAMLGTNAINAVINKNGRRVRPPQSSKYIGDGTTVTYALPPEQGYNQALMADNDVSVYVNDNYLILGIDFFVNPFDDSSIERTVTLVETPASGAIIIVSVRTAAQAWIVGDTVQFQPTQGIKPVVGDIISVTTWNDTAYQDILTQVFEGPSTQGQVLAQGFDTVAFDTATFTDDPGSFDYSEGTEILVNRFDLGFNVEDPARLTVTLDGAYLYLDRGYVTEGQFLTITGPLINASQVVAVTSYTANVVPNPTVLRIFQDMRGLQRLYRITPDTTTQLARALSATDDIIYVDDASVLGQPDPQRGNFGLITINGERISYLERDLATNTLSRLRRGTAGTGAANHAADSFVYTIDRGDLLPAFYQNTLFFDNLLGNGSQTVFVTEGINLNYLTPAQLERAVLVYVGGILQTSGYAVTSAAPPVITFDEPVPDGYQVRVEVRRGQWLYDIDVESSLQENGSLGGSFLTDY